MKKKWKLLRLVFAVLILLPLCAKATGTWTTLDYPGASKTFLTGISGSKIVGYANGHGIVYDTTSQSWATLDVQGAQSTEIDAIDGSYYAGKYRDASGDHGFLYNGTNWITFNVPGDRLNIAGISGQTIVGNYRSGNNNQGFTFDGTTLNSLTISLTNYYSYHIYGIDGSNIVGNYFDAYGDYGFLYDGTNTMPLAMPGAEWTWATDIDGEKIVGSSSLCDFLYNRTTNAWTILDTPAIPPLQSSDITGIDGNLIVGYYVSGFESVHGFVGTIPEPTTLFLLGFGMIVARKKLSK